MFNPLREFLQKPHNPNIMAAKQFIDLLHDVDLLYHFDDPARDCLAFTGIDTPTIDAIQNYVNYTLFDDRIEWGEHGCPHGYALYLINGNGGQFND